jgi:hypothetical protein
VAFGVRSKDRKRSPLTPKKAARTVPTVKRIFLAATINLQE